MTFASEKIRAFSVGDRVNLVSSKTWGDTTHHVEATFPKDDAPAVALAVLEAAGIDGKQSSHAHHAARALMDHESVRQLEAEREAEDAKAREFRESSLSAIASVFNESNVDAKEWSALSETGRESWYARYRAARKFFEGS